MVGKGAGRASARADNTVAPADERTPIRVILADSQAIFRVGISKILSAEPDIQVVGQSETLGQTLQTLARVGADVLLFEAELSPTPAEAVSEVLKRSPEMCVVVLVNDLSEAETVDYLRRGVRGLVPRAVAPELLVRCVHKVFEGEPWVDHRGINWVIKAFRAQAAQMRSTDPRHRLSEKEMLIISGVTQGLRNKDIAHEIGTTEQVVKNYLRKIYDKLGISDRLELALYTVHERLLESGRNAAETPAATPQPADGPVAVPSGQPEPEPGNPATKTGKNRELRPPNAPLR